MTNSNPNDMCARCRLQEKCLQLREAGNHESLDTILEKLGAWEGGRVLYCTSKLIERGEVSLEEVLQELASVGKERSVPFSDILECDAKRDLFYSKARQVFGMEDEACCSIGTKAFPFCRILKEVKTPYSAKKSGLRCVSVPMENLSQVADCVRQFFS